MVGNCKVCNLFIFGKMRPEPFSNGHAFTLMLREFYLVFSSNLSRAVSRHSIGNAASVFRGDVFVSIIILMT